MFELLGKHRKRLVFAGLTALAGLIVSIAMIYLGGHHAGQLPGVAFHITATLGAGAAGWFCMGAFGHAATVGWMIALTGGIGMTILGAVFAGIMIGGYFNGLGGAIAFPALGFIAIIDAAESPHAVLVWLTCMSGLHLLAGSIHRRGSV
jgi:hypothetical protein